MSGSRHADGDGRKSGIIAMAASDGGPVALRAILASLPEQFPAPILVVQHRHPESKHFLRMLAQRSALRVTAALDGDLPQPGHVHVLPPTGRATLDPGGCISISGGGRLRADPLFESLAGTHAEKTIAVVLTGRLDDGAAGVCAIKRGGGQVIVQDRDSADAFGMPAAAIATGCADHVLPLRSIGAALVALTMVPGAPELFRARLTPWATLATDDSKRATREAPKGG